MRLRNPLFIPAASERKVTKAYASDADAVSLDLEDRVRPHPLPSRVVIPICTFVMTPC